MQETPEQNIYAYKFDDVIVHLTDFRVQKAGQPQKITPLSFEVLAYLVKNPGRVVEKQELFEKIWRETIVSDNALTRVIREIRQVIGDDASSPRYVETVPKRGYRFIAEVEKLETENNGFEKIEKASLQTQDYKRPIHTKSSNRLLIIIAALLLLTVPLIIWLVFRKPQPTNFPSAIAYTAQLTNWSGLDNYPAISPDGNSVAYSSDRNGHFEIYIQSLAPGAKAIQLTSDGQQNFQPAWSPDGQRIAFYSRKRGGIWTVPSSGGTVKQLTDFGSRPSFSPDGKQIAFQSGALTDLGINSQTLAPSVLWIIPGEGGKPRQLTQIGNPTGGHGSPTWSPDGKRIAFNVGDVASTSIWSINIENGKLQKINTRSTDPVYAADGKSLYFVSVNGLWQIPVSPADDKVSGEPKQVTDDGPGQIRHLSISADGKKIAYGMMLSSSRIYAHLLNKESEPVSLLHNTSSRNTFPVFSPDGTRIAYVTARTNSPREVWMMNADGQNPTQVGNDAGISNWFSDGQRIAVFTQRDETSKRDGTSKLFSINLTGGKETLLFDFKSRVEYARLSPDGRKVAFNSSESGTINVWIGNLETGEQKPLTFDGELAGFPIWSSDGKWLSWQIKRGDDTHIMVMPAEGGTPVQLTNERGQSWMHSFSSDGEYIAFAGQRDDIWNIYTVSRTTKETKKLTNFNKLNIYVRYPSWSPLGDKIVFEYAETTGNIWLTELK